MTINHISTIQKKLKQNEMYSPKLDRELTWTTSVGAGLSEAISNVGAIKDEFDFVVEPRFEAIENRVSTLESNAGSELTIQPLSQFSDEAFAEVQKVQPEALKTAETSIEAKQAIKDGYALAAGAIGEFQFVTKPKLADHESRIATLESNAGSGTDSGNCLDSNLTVKPLIRLSNEAFAELKKQQPEAEQNTETSFGVRQVIKDGFEYALGVSGELQFVTKPAINELKTKVGEFETIDLGTLETGRDMYGNLVYADSSMTIYSNLTEAIQGVNANVSKNKSVIEATTNKAISLSSQMSTMNTRVDNISTEVDKLIADKNPTDDYHTYHKYHRLFTKTVDFPVVESAITFKYGNIVGVTKLKFNVYKDQVNTFQITSDMIPNHLKDASTLQCALILSLDYPGTFIRDGITISNETDVLFKLENVFIDVANNANSGAIIGDITLKNFTIYANDSVITVSMYNKPLTYTLIVEHDESLSGVTGIDLINIQHNINDETASRTIKFLDNSTEIIPTVTKVVL